MQSVSGEGLFCGGNPLGTFGLVCLGGAFRENVFLMVEVDFLKMWRKLLDEGGLMADWRDDNFDKDLLILVCGSLWGSCKYRCLFYMGRGGGQV